VDACLFCLGKSVRHVLGEDIGRAMMHATLDGIRGRIIENREIRAMAERFARDEARLASGAHS